MEQQKVRTEEININGDEILAKVKSLLHEGNIRRIIVKNEEGRTIVEFPLLIGLIGAAALPVVAAVGAIAALAARLTLVIEKVEEPATPAEPPQEVVVQ
jgi:hypothetical protein